MRICINCVTHDCPVQQLGGPRFTPVIDSPPTYELDYDGLYCQYEPDGDEHVFVISVMDSYGRELTSLESQVGD